MNLKNLSPILLLILAFVLISIACATSQSIPTGTPEPTPTITPPSTNTPRPSPTPRPTWTPDIAATQHIEKLATEVQTYYEKGLITTNNGTLIELDNFSSDLAHLGGYEMFRLPVLVSDFLLGAHFKWDSASKNADTAGCGFIFGLQPNEDHYAVFLDRTKVEFRISRDRFSTNVKPINVKGKVKFSYPAEADFTLIVNDASAYVLVDGQIVSEYTLLRGRPLQGEVGLTVLSGTNKDYGTRCEMTDLRLWIPEE